MINQNRFHIVITALLSMLMLAQVASAEQVSGELKVWHKVTITFDGPKSSETATPNPFLDYRLNVTFRRGSKKYVVPGYFAADGDAANTSAESGNKWRVHFAPDEAGTWQYLVSFREGNTIAVNDDSKAGSSGGYMDGKTGKLKIGPTDKTGRDHRGKGRLQYVGEHYLRFAETGEYFLKGGADAPENFLSYEDFDNTPNNEGYRKRWEPHADDWNPGDPSWQDGKGTEIIGAINYLSGKGMNAFSFLTMNAPKGDDENVFMWISTDSDDRTRFDVSKLAQWEIVFEHADKMGMYLHFKTQEQENDQMLNGGDMGTERMMYYRELIARFSHHLALNWNTGEENNQPRDQQRAIAQYFYDHDPYNHNRVIHTFYGDKDEVYGALIGDQSKYTGTSLYSGNSSLHRETTEWVRRSADAGKKWIVACDEQGGASSANPSDWGDPSDSDYWHDDTRKGLIWGGLMAGGAGIEFYFGYDDPCNDLTCQDWRSRDHLWHLMGYALEFFHKYLPFWEMSANDGLTTNDNDWVMEKPGEVYAIYMPNCGSNRLDLSGVSGTFPVRWYDPRYGGALQTGSVTSVTGGGIVSLGNPPGSIEDDCAILVGEMTPTLMPGNTPGGTTTVSYTPDFGSVFPNPERGWHNRRDVDGRGGDDDRDFSDVKVAGHTLVHSYLRLDDYRNTDTLPQSYLDDLQDALDAIREYDLKIILRPSHVWSESPSVPEERILGHIAQINAVISANADVVSHLEAGYLGKWGEWHSGLYTELSSQSDGDTRYRIIKKILDTTPDTIPIAMRYPMHIREILDELPVPDGSEPLTQVQRDRLGHHNDCFLYNEHDRGTYARGNLWFGDQTLEQQKQYAFGLITSYGGNKIMGGETCSPAIDRVGDTQIDMAEANWTEININFWGVAIDMWKKRWLPANGNDPAEWEFDRILRKLGYRLRLIDATFPPSATAGGSFTIAANLSNDGYASVVKPRPIYLVFDNGTDRYNIELSDVDVRKWVSGDVTLSQQTVTLPSGMPSGTYTLALWLPDYYTNLQSRPEYSIRFADLGVWDATKGYNVLSDSVTISQ